MILDDKQLKKITEEVKQAIIKGVKSSFTNGALVEPETHENHHRWIHAKIEKEQACIENRRRITTHVIGWLAVSFISGIGFLLWLGYTTYRGQG